jgi:hypothetical protein
MPQFFLVLRFIFRYAFLFIIGLLFRTTYTAAPHFNPPGTHADLTDPLYIVRNHIVDQILSKLFN